MDTMDSVLYGIMYNDYNKADKSGHTETCGYVVDTCDTEDCGYETAIWYKDNDMVIVDRYGRGAKGKEKSLSGHQKWVDFVKKNKPKEIYSVQTDCIEKLI